MLTLLALHGSSRDEADLVEFCRQIAPDSHLVAPRGAFAEGEGYTFFRRRTDRTIPSTEVVALAEGWLSREASHLESLPEKPVIVGYSSGAIFAEALLTVKHSAFAGALLLRPEPLDQEFAFPIMEGKPILILAGRHDERRRTDDAPRLAVQFRTAQADVILHILDAGHGWAPNNEDTTLARTWFSRFEVD